MEEYNASMMGTIFTPPKIVNGSQIAMGYERGLKVIVGKHFNWFQKKMLKWCFGFVVTDYSEVD